MKNLKRLTYIDVAKLFAIIFVLMCHIPIVYGMEATDANIGIGWLTNFIVGTMGVPLFMMCTGTLVLTKKFESVKEVLGFYKRNLLTIYITGVIWCLIYYFLTNLHTNEGITMYGIVKTILLVNKPEVHLWYIRMILMYYIMIPLISFLLHKHTNVFMGIVAITAFLTFGRNGYEILVNNNPCPTTSGLSLSCYLVYLAIGYWLSDDRFSSLTKNRNSLLTLGGTLFFMGLASSISLRHLGWYKFMWYDNPFILIASVGFFIVVKTLFENKTANQVVSELSKMTFGVYLCHMVILLYCMPIMLELIHLPEIFEWAIIMAVTMLCSFGIVYATKYIPLLSKILFRY